VSDGKPVGNEFTSRVITGVLLVIVAGFCVWSGGLVFAALVAIGAVLALREWRALTRLAPLIYLPALALLGIALAMAVVDARLSGLFKAGGIALAGGILLALASKGRGGGLAYVGLPAICLLWLRTLPWGLEAVAWILVVVITTDVFAYASGRTIGGRKLAPRISPGKTWSGLIGGVIAATIFGWGAAMLLHLPHWMTFTGGFMAVLAQCGDLFESWLKRRAGVKDSGNILPGHGGVLDRIDGLLPVALATAIGMVLGMVA